MKTFYVIANLDGPVWPHRALDPAGQAAANQRAAGDEWGRPNTRTGWSGGRATPPARIRPGDEPGALVDRLLELAEKSRYVA